MNFQKIFICIFFFSFYFNSCVSKKSGPTEINYSFKKVSWDKELIKETKLNQQSLVEALEHNLNWVENRKTNDVFNLKDLQFNKEDYIYACKKLLNDLKENKQILTSLNNYFNLYKLNLEDNKQVLFTGYYIPLTLANKERSQEYQIPVYTVPNDLITIYLEDFNPAYKGKIIRGRVNDQRLVPYWTREQIVNGQKLNKQGLEISWVKDKIDLFFIEIQGSGILVYPDGSQKYIQYASQNGREYKPIGAKLIKENVLEKKNVSMQTIRNWLAQNPKDQDRILNYNSSFVFFSLQDDGPFGNIQVKLTGERSLAADQRIFPAGTLTLANFEKPNAKDKNTIENFSQLAFVQDTGGAIKGPNRIDVFWGKGKNAGEIAGETKQNGDLYILVPKKDLKKTNEGAETQNLSNHSSDPKLTASCLAK